MSKPPRSIGHSRIIAWSPPPPPHLTTIRYMHYNIHRWHLYSSPPSHSNTRRTTRCSPCPCTSLRIPHSTAFQVYQVPNMAQIPMAASPIHDNLGPELVHHFCSNIYVQGRWYHPWKRYIHLKSRYWEQRWWLTSGPRLCIYMSWGSVPVRIWSAILSAAAALFEGLEVFKDLG